VFLIYGYSDEDNGEVLRSTNLPQQKNRKRLHSAFYSQPLLLADFTENQTIKIQTKNPGTRKLESIREWHVVKWKTR
jgi:hypothetical protein